MELEGRQIDAGIVLNRYVSMLREKEQRLMRMGDDLSRLTLVEDESRKKDEVIEDLRHRIAEMEITTAVSKLVFY